MKQPGSFLGKSRKWMKRFLIIKTLDNQDFHWYLNFIHPWIAHLLHVEVLWRRYTIKNFTFIRFKKKVLPSSVYKKATFYLKIFSCIDRTSQGLIIKLMIRSRICADRAELGANLRKPEKRDTRKTDKNPGTEHGLMILLMML
jgi:hypothetical protein